VRIEMSCPHCGNGIVILVEEADESWVDARGAVPDDGEPAEDTIRRLRDMAWGPWPRVADEPPSV
jgi:hypothetical protein